MQSFKAELDDFVSNFNAESNFSIAKKTLRMLFENSSCITNTARRKELIGDLNSKKDIATLIFYAKYLTEHFWECFEYEYAHLGKHRTMK